MYVWRIFYNRLNQSSIDKVKAVRETGSNRCWNRKTAVSREKTNNVTEKHLCLQRLWNHRSDPFITPMTSATADYPVREIRTTYFLTPYFYESDIRHFINLHVDLIYVEAFFGISSHGNHTKRSYGMSTSHRIF